ncbi:MAG: alpha/beta fold hydrolase, partial [Anaerolineales bacterium]|nr:alpha/beta fold hydrolase [Anaerolineales bacterium]
ATATLTVVPSATPPAPPTATPTPHPMSIAALRQREFPGSDIVIESELEPGVNYRRYYASYLSDGLKIYALLTVPNGERPAAGWPAIVFNHGFIPPDVYRTTQRYVAYVDNLARSGYIVFRIDYRGHDQSEGEARGAYGDPGYIADVLNAAASLRRFAEADPARIGMWGHSMGGYLTLRAMVVDPGIRAGVIWAGVVAPYPDLFARGSDFLTPPPTSAAGGDPAATPAPGRRWRSAWIAQYGTPDENPEFWNSISSNAYLSEISGPLQLHHGTADESVPLAASETLYGEMLAAGRTVEFYTYADDNHNLSGFFTTAMQRTLAFYDLYLKGN